MKQARIIDFARRDLVVQATTIENPKNHVKLEIKAVTAEVITVTDLPAC